MWIPDISSLEQGVLMLVSHATTLYHKWVPFQEGIRIIIQVVKNIVDEEVRSLSQSYEGTVLSKSSEVGKLDKEFDLNQVRGNVVITKKVTIPVFKTIVVKGLTKVIKHCKYVHVLVEPPPKCQNIFVPGNTTELNPGGSRVDVVLQNLSGREVTLKTHNEVGMISAANKILLMLTSEVVKGDVQDDEHDKKIQSKSAQVDLSEYEPKPNQGRSGRDTPES